MAVATRRKIVDRAIADKTMICGVEIFDCIHSSRPIFRSDLPSMLFSMSDRDFVREALLGEDKPGERIRAG
jgi:hypothetical protein